MKRTVKKLTLHKQVVSALEKTAMNSLNGGLIIVELSVDGCGADREQENNQSDGCLQPTSSINL